MPYKEYGRVRVSGKSATVAADGKLSVCKVEHLPKEMLYLI